jgi:drug/metabolite transporter (DMT)-like permease
VVTGVVVSPRLPLPEDALLRTAIPLVCGAVMLLVAAGLAGEFHSVQWWGVSVRSVLGLAYLIAFGSVVAFTAYTWLLQQCPPTLVATHAYANPAVAVFLGWLFAAEPLNARLVLASVAILGAILLIQRGERKGSADASQKSPGGQSSNGLAVIAGRPPIVGRAIPRLARKAASYR